MTKRAILWNSMHASVPQAGEPLVLEGMHGLETAYQFMQDILSSGDTIHRFSATHAATSARLCDWCSQQYDRLARKGINQNVIANESAQRNTQILSPRIQKRYVQTNATAEIVIAHDTVFIITLEKNPQAVVIESAEIAHAYRQSFNNLWMLARN